MTPPATHVDTTLTPTKIPTISPIVPSSLDYTLASPDYSPASNMEFNPSEITCSIGSTSSPSHDSCTQTAYSSWSTVPYHLNGPVRMMTARNTYRLAVRHSVEYSSSDLFTSNDSSDTSLDSSSDDLSDSSSGHSSSDHSSPALPSGIRSSHQLCSLLSSIPHSSAAITERLSHPSFAGPSRNRSRPPTTSVPISLLVPSKSSVPRETSLRDDVVVKGSDEPYSKHDIDPKIQAEIDECIAYVDALRAEGIDARVVVEVVAQEEVKMSTRGLVKVRLERVMHPAVLDDIPEPAQKEGVIEGTYDTLGYLVQRFHDHTIEIPAHRVQLERDNMRLRGTLDVASQRVSRLQWRELRVRREMRQI
ncbi:hypothetical protein Tco_0429397 [Tanacetum coccineum]